MPGVGHKRIKPEHTEAKNGGGARMARAEAKETAKCQREDKDTSGGGDQGADDWGDLDEFSARGSEPTLRRLDRQEAAAGFSWKKETLTGEPMPDVADAVRRSRESH
jgi:hypothetical protein